MMNPKIRERILFPKVAIIADSDGVLVGNGTTEVSSGLQSLFRLTPTLTFVASGRPLPWCWEIGSQVNARGVFAENGIRYQFTAICDGKVVAEQTASVVRNSDIPRLKELINFRVTKTPRATIEIDGVQSPILFEPGKKEILTLATREIRDQKLSIALDDCRWTSEKLYVLMLDVIRRASLRVEAMGPYPDGNIDYQPVDGEGEPFDKRRIPAIIKARFPWVEQFVALIDGPNDPALAAHRDVFPITFSNGCDAVKEIVSARGGWIIEKAGYEGGCLEALYRIRREFLGLTQSSKWNEQQRAWVVREDPTFA